MSNYEQYITLILLKSQIKFEREKTFSDLRRGKYRFDFYLPEKNICIEIDGEQHFKYIPHFHKSLSGFKKQQERDRRKNSYCLANDIKLYRIPYDRVYTIKTFREIISEEFLVKSKWHLDNLNRR